MRCGCSCATSPIPSVGCVTGEARYLPGGNAVADVGERLYWNYEMQIKRLETALGSMVGGDGAIYAIRKSLWRTLPENAINDFLNPLQIVAAGWRAVYEPEAVCFEETAGGTRAEYRRRVRIVSRSWRAVFQARACSTRCESASSHGRCCRTRCCDGCRGCSRATRRAVGARDCTWTWHSNGRWLPWRRSAGIGGAR